MIIKHFLMILTVIIAPGICTADEYDPKPDRREPRPMYPIYSWPQDLVSVPCSAWKKDNLGAWALTGTLNWEGGDSRLWSPTFQPITPEGAVVEQKCAATK